MSDPFVGEIRMFAGGFAPRTYALCDGQLLNVSQNEALFSLLGTIYGGDGRSTFGLPDMRGRIPMHYGTGPGLSNKRIGQKGGVENVTLTTNQMPAHTHAWKVSGAAAQNRAPSGNTLATPSSSVFAAAANLQPLNVASVGNKGGSQQHTNVQPFQCVNFIIALYGIYPSRN